MSNIRGAGSRGIFVTATDTGVGKTVVSAAIIRRLIKEGVKAGAMKPMETGCIEQDGILVPADGMFLRRAAEMSDVIDLVTPIRYKLPLAPYTASIKEGRPVNLDAVFEAYSELSLNYEFMVVEGVGGVRVPLAKSAVGDIYFVTDLIKKLCLPAVVVTRPLLGTINHTLLTVERLLCEGIEVKGIVVSSSSPSQGTIAEKTNLEMLRELCPVPVIGVLPHLEEVSISSIDAYVAEAIDIEKI